MSTINVTTARSTLYRLIDQVAEESRPIRITGQRSTAVLVSEEDWEAIQETLYLQAVPGMVDSIRQAREESVEAASEELTGERLDSALLTPSAEGRTMNK